MSDAVRRMHESEMRKDFKVERKRCGSADGEMYECGMYEECARFMWHWLCLSRAPIALAGEGTRNVEYTSMECLKIA